VNLVYSNGYHPMPKLSFASALPVGTESLHETLEVQYYDSMCDGPLRERIAEQLPSGLEIVSLEEPAHEAGSLKVKESHYEISFDGVGVGEEDLKRFLAADSFPLIKRRKKGDQRIDARSQVKSAYFSTGSTVRLALKHMEGPALKPAEIIQGIFHLSDEDLGGISVLKSREILDDNSEESESQS